MGLLGLAFIVSASTARADVTMATYTYKKVGDLEIKANVYRNAAAQGAAKRPVLMWIHGGALIVGSRGSFAKLGENALPLAPAMFAANYLVVSIDYRLAPETKLPGIVEDVRDAYRWIHNQGPKLFGADPERIAIAGSSAGAYLTLTVGFLVHPRPVALVSLWGYGDLVGPWMSEPSTAPRLMKITTTREEAFRQVSGPPIANSHDRKGSGGKFSQYCRHHGLWPEAISGWDPHREAEKFYPYMAVKNVTPDYPPTLLVHGASDTEVPPAQSEMMAAEFRKNGVEHEFISVPGGEHALGDADPQAVDATYRRAFEYLRDHFEKK